MPAQIAAQQPLMNAMGGVPDYTEVITQAHQRSQEYGVHVQDRPDFVIVDKGDLIDMHEQAQVLYRHAMPVMETLYDQIANTHSMVLLTTAEGLVLHSLGDHDFLEKASRVALAPGGDWSEQAKGTNAIGTALMAESILIGDVPQSYIPVPEVEDGLNFVA